MDAPAPTRNGHGKATAALPTDPTLVRQQRRLIREQIQMVKLQREAKLLESLMWDDFGGQDLYDRLRPHDQDADGTVWLPSVPSDRRHGANWPLYRTEFELDQIRQRSRVLVASNGYASGLLRNLTNYVIGKGFSYQAAAKENAGDGEQLTALVRQVQASIDHFLQLNHWNGTIDPCGNLSVAGSRERETYRRVIRDGEAFLMHFPQDDGTMLVRFVEPERVRTLTEGRPEEGWAFGRRHQMTPFEDVETILEYHLFWADPTGQKGIGELVEADRILHLKGPDTDGNLARGLPAFSFDTAAAFERAARLQRNLSLGAAYRAATAEIQQFATATRQQIEDFRGEMQAGPARTDSTTGQTLFSEKLTAPAVRRIPKGQEFIGQPPDNSQAYIAAVQADLRAGISTFCAPEYMTGDASNADYSSTKEAGAPFVKAGETDQEYFKSAFLRVVWKAVQWAVECGQLDRRALTLIDVQVEAPSVLHVDILEKAQADTAQVSGGWKSPQTCAMEAGLDPETEFSNIEEYRERMGGQGAGLQLPPDDGNDAASRASFGESVRELALWESNPEGHNQYTGASSAAHTASAGAQEKSATADDASVRVISPAEHAVAAEIHAAAYKAHEVALAAHKVAFERAGSKHQKNAHKAMGLMHKEAMADHNVAMIQHHGKGGEPPASPFAEAKDASGHEHAADGKFGTGGGAGGGENGGEDDAGKASLYRTRSGAGEPSPEVDAAGKAQRQALFDRLYQPGEFKNEWPGEADPQQDFLTKLTYHVLRGSTSNDRELGPVYHDETMSAEIWQGARGGVAEVTSLKNGDYKISATRNLSRTSKRIPAGATDDHAAYLIHKVLGVKPPPQLAEKYDKLRTPK